MSCFFSFDLIGAGRLVHFVPFLSFLSGVEFRASSSLAPLSRRGLPDRRRGVTGQGASPRSAGEGWRNSGTRERENAGARRAAPPGPQESQAGRGLPGRGGFCKEGTSPAASLGQEAAVSTGVPGALAFNANGGFDAQRGV